MKDNCPKCNTSFIGEPIPEKDQEFYGGATHFRREIGIEDPEIYDGIAVYTCPDCDHYFPRNSSEWATDLFNKFMEKHKEKLNG